MTRFCYIIIIIIIIIIIRQLLIQDTRRDNSRQEQPSLYLHNTIPIITGRNSKQRQERHSEVLKVSVFAEPLAWMQFGTL